MVNQATLQTAPEITHLNPVAPRARVRKRHGFVAASFLFLVVAPVAIGAVYLYTRAADQFASTVAFSVRKDEISTPLDLLGGIADFSSSGSLDAEILHEYIASQEIVSTLDIALGLREMYARPVSDPVFRLKPGSSIEDLHDYWSRMVHVNFDPGTGLIQVTTRAFDPEDARSIAAAIYGESARLVETLSQIAQDDTTEFARGELALAFERMKEARAELTAFRSRTQIVDPAVDLQGQMGLLSMLEQQLAVALIDADLLRESTRAADPRLTQADRRISLIEARIDNERRNLGFGGEAGDGSDYASLMSEYERLAVDREFAEQAYTAALATYDAAQAEARRKSRYLAAHIKPTLAETAQFPDRVVILALGFLFLGGAWAVLVLVYYSLRDRR